jgi:hypothetical protein
MLASVWMPALGADVADGDGVIERERRANGDHELAHARLVGIAQLGEGQPLGFDLDHGNVRLGINALHPGRVGFSVFELHGDLLRVLDDVRVGEDEAVLADDHAGTLAHGRRRAAAR